MEPSSCWHFPHLVSEVERGVRLTGYVRRLGAEPCLWDEHPGIRRLLWRWTPRLFTASGCRGGAAVSVLGRPREHTSLPLAECSGLGPPVRSGWQVPL